MNIKQWIAEHPYATGGIVIVGGLLLLMMSRNSSGSSAPSATSLQVAQLNTAAQLQAMTIQAQQNATAIQAQVQNNGIAASLAATKIAADTEIAKTNAGVKQATDLASIQASLFKDAIDQSTIQTATNAELAKYSLDKQFTLAQSGVNLAKQGGRADAGTNVVALALNQGNISSYNNGNAASSIASSLSTAQLIASIFKSGSSLLGGLFG